MISSSPIDSPPTSIHRSSSVSVRSAKRTYSRRISAHKEKRKAEVQAAGETSDSGDEAELGLRSTGPKGPRTGREGSQRRDGSPVPKRRKQSGTGAEVEDDNMWDEGTMNVQPASAHPQRPTAKRTRSSKSLLSSPPASRSPSPSPPTNKGALSSSSTSDASSSASKLARPRLHSRANPKRHNTAPNVNIEPPSSSPPRPTNSSAPSTPPRRTRTVSGPSTPRSSPRDLSSLFAAVSPRKDSPNSPAGQKDDYFGVGAHRGAIGRPGGLRRMLTKTQSMGMVPTTPSRSEKNMDKTGGGGEDGSPFGSGMSPGGPSTPSRGLRMTQSMPESPTKSSPRGGESSTAATLVIPASASTGQTGSGGRAKRTYGKTRTILVEVPQGEVEEVSKIPSRKDQEDDSPPQASYAELREKFEVDNSITASGSGSGNLMPEFLMAKAPQTVSDMRSRGENRRFTDELGYLVDGIADSSTGISFKRSSAIDILNNMQDESWLNKMKICGQVETVWECLFQARGEEADEIMNAVCLLFLVTLLQSGSGLASVVQHSPAHCVSLIKDSLKIRNGPLDNNAKVKVTAAKLRNLQRKTNMTWIATEPTTRRLASALLAALCQEELWPSINAIFVDEQVLSKVLKSFKNDIRILSDRFDLYEKGLRLLPSEDWPDFDNLNQSLRIISSVIANDIEQRETVVQQRSDVVHDLINAVIGTSELVFASDESDLLEVSQCTVQAIQILANLTNVSPEWAMTIPKTNGGLVSLARLVLQRNQIVSEDGSETLDKLEESMQTEVDINEQAGPAHQRKDVKGEVSKKELICLILALLTSSALSEKESAEIMSGIRIAGDCVGRHACLRHCHCHNAESLGEHLAKLYAEFVNDDEDPMSSILTGYLALLLSKLLAVSSSSNNDDILKSLPGSSPKEKINGVLSSLRELNSLQSIMQKTIKDILPKGASSEDVGTMEASMVEYEADVVDEAIREMRELLGSVI
nr:uncharacterized protein CI109_001267 [Kwoniella shandongensis]KAA5530464.1 hypothetical protein CI109_001267 [Kwoniella shandongensis]